MAGRGTNRLARSLPRLPGQLQTPEVVIDAPLEESTAFNNASLKRGVNGLDEGGGGAPPPFEINVERATPTNSMDDESCLEEETEIQLDNTTKHHQNKSRPMSVLSTASRTNSSLLALPDNMRNLLKNLANRARGKDVSRTIDLTLTPATSVSDLRPINTGMLKRRLDSFARPPESETDSETEDEKAKNLFCLCKSCPRARTHITKVTNHLKKCRCCTCDYYVDPYGKHFYKIVVMVSLLNI